MYRFERELCDILEDSHLFVPSQIFRSLIHNPKPAYTQTPHKPFLLLSPLMSSTCCGAVVAAARTDTVSIPGPAASLRA